ncbi:glycosyltransferase family 25 protein [Lophiostoma macrostomum CBS 122681]|uniref:Glycosyltransferase family 25 protein n=1 Tax=Lophiostoma macrostomum CBS 122681 TaxID=1314788 RepID=A0A6A6SLH9_9PLEO|nr:glycosyltransferase family 25 protein [Lophiostoma macrostomum CBS 122681]
MLAASRPKTLPLLATATVLLIIFFYHKNTDYIRLQWTAATAPSSPSSIDAEPQKLAANRTLGFGAVLVVSKDGSERRHSLLQAANVTDIELTIPHQPTWTEGDVEKFVNNEEDHVQKGSILAWLGHHNALRWFLDSNLETAIILEDDVDWDIRLRSVQVPLAASAVRSILPPARSVSHAASASGDLSQYWGNPASWDLLYLGHCGDYFGEVNNDGPKPPEKGFDWEGLPHVLYRDPSLPVKDDLHPFTKSLFDALKMGEHQRAFHRSKFPLCSFGYAVTRPAAERLLSDLAPPKFKPKGPRAFDVALLHACGKGAKTPSPTPLRNPKPHPDPKLRHKYASPGLRCWTLNSELFHHMPGESQIAQIGEASGEKHGLPPVDLAGQDQLYTRRETTNIGCGFWGGAFSFEPGDTKRLAYLQEEVGRKGHCLKEGKATMRTKRSFTA